MGAPDGGRPPVFRVHDSTGPPSAGVSADGGDDGPASGEAAPLRYVAMDLSGGGAAPLDPLDDAGAHAKAANGAAHETATSSGKRPGALLALAQHFQVRGVRVWGFRRRAVQAARSAPRARPTRSCLRHAAMRSGSPARHVQLAATGALFSHSPACGPVPMRLATHTAPAHWRCGAPPP